MKKYLLIYIITCMSLLHGDGTLDGNFGNGSGFIALPPGFYARGIAIQDDAKIVAVGSSILNQFQIVRYNFDGSFDSTFYGTGIGEVGPDGVPFSVIAQPDGSLIVVGQDATGSNFQLAKYTSDGKLDTTYGSSGVVVGPAGFAVDSALQIDGKVIAAGNNNAGKFLVVRYTTSGSVDMAFDLGPFGFIESVKVQFDGKVIAAGTDNNGNMQVARYNSNGTLDNTFGTGGVVTGPQGVATSLVIQPNGYYVIGGSDLNNPPNMLLVRFNNSGVLDNTFGISGVVTGPSGFLANAIALQSDGSIVVAGEGSSDIKLTRYNSSGNLDISFGISGIVVDGTGDVFGVALQQNGYTLTVGIDLISNDFEVARYTGSQPLTATALTSPATNALGGLTITGTAQNPSQLFLYVDGTFLGSLNTDSLGGNTWSFPTSISFAGLYTLRVVSIYKDGNSSSATVDELRIYG